MHDAVGDDALGLLLGLYSSDRFIHELGFPKVWSLGDLPGRASRPGKIKYVSSS
jgi:hypothetical protein